MREIMLVQMMDKRLTDEDELLLRNIHPSWMDGDKLTSQAFKPTPKDEDQLSCDRFSKTSPEDCWVLHTESKGLESCAVFGVTVGEFNGEGVDCIDDPIVGGSGQVANPAHAIADYSPIPSQNKKEKVAKKIRAKAVARGVLFPLPED